MNRAILLPALAGVLPLVSVHAASQESVRKVGGEVWNTKFLTRDTTDRWKFEAKPGTVVGAAVETSEFDPVLSLIRVSDDGEQVLVSRDDPGNASRLIHRIQVRGKYEIRVHAFEQKGGGNYRLMIARFAAQSAEIAAPIRGTISRDKRAACWFRASAGDIVTYSMRGSASIFTFYDARGRDCRRWHHALEVPVDGEVYVRLQGKPGTRFELRFDRAQRGPMPEGEGQKIELGGMRMHVFEFTGDQGDFRMIEMRHASVLGHRIVRRERKSGQVVVEPTRSVIGSLPVTSKGGCERRAFVVLEPGRFQFEVLSLVDSPAELDIRMTDPSLALSPGEPVRGSLEVGGARFYSFAAKPGEFLRFDLEAKGFDPLLRVSDHEGTLVVRDDDGGPGLASQASLLIRKLGTYRVQVASSGDGGGGDYELRLQRVAIPELVIGRVHEATITAGSWDYVHLTGKRGQEVFLSAKGAVDTRLEIMDPSGVVLGRDTDGGVGHDSLLAVRLPRDGVYTVAVGCDRGTGGYTLRAIDG